MTIDTVNIGSDNSTSGNSSGSSSGGHSSTDASRSKPPPTASELQFIRDTLPDYFTPKQLQKIASMSVANMNKPTGATSGASSANSGGSGGSSSSSSSLTSLSAADTVIRVIDRTVYVDNLHFAITTAQIVAHFGGTRACIERVRLGQVRTAGLHKRGAVLVLAGAMARDRALLRNGTILRGRVISVTAMPPGGNHSPAAADDDDGDDDDDAGEELEEERDAGNGASANDGRVLEAVAMNVAEAVEEVEQEYSQAPPLTLADCNTDIAL